MLIHHWWITRFLLTMMPSRLFQEAAAHMAPIADWGDPENARRERDTEAKRRLGERANDTVNMLACISVDDSLRVEYLEAPLETRQDGEVWYRSRKRMVSFELRAEEPLQNFAPIDEEGLTPYFRKKITIGINDLQTHVDESGATEEIDWDDEPIQKGVAIDVVTELVLGVEEIEDVDEEWQYLLGYNIYNPFDEFQTLERVNWRHSVFGTQPDLEGINPFSSRVDVSTETINQANQRARMEDLQATIAGVHAALDDAEGFSLAFNHGVRP